MFKLLLLIEKEKHMDTAKTISFEALDKLVWAKYPKLLKDFGYEDCDVKRDLGISYYHFSCTNPIMRHRLARKGWYTYKDQKGNKMLQYDMSTLKDVRALADKVVEAYESGYFISTFKYFLFWPYYFLFTNYHQSACNSWHYYIKPKWADKFWYDEMGFGGDDDVDYNGGYLDIVYDMVEIADPHIGDDHPPIRVLENS